MNKYSFRIYSINQKTFSEKAKAEAIRKRLGVEGIEPKLHVSEEDANIKLTAFDPAKLTHYEGYHYIDPNCVGNLMKWIKKPKDYKEIDKDNLQVTLKIFNFELKRVKKTDTEVLKEEISSMKKENRVMLGHLKLLRHYFFKYWNDSIARSFLEDNIHLKEALMDDAINLYDILTASGMVKEEYGSKCYYLNFKQTPGSQKKHAKDLNYFDEEITPFDRLKQQIGDFEKKSSLSDDEDTTYEDSLMMSHHHTLAVTEKITKDRIEVFIDGDLFNYERADLIKKYTFQSETDSRGFSIRVNKKVAPGDKYLVHIPKILGAYC